jgi:endonuclease III
LTSGGRATRRAPADWRRPTARRVRAIRDRLRLVYGRPLAAPHGHPIAELVLTVLSQSTNDRNRDVAYLALRERFPGDTWVLVRDAPVDVVEEAIRPGGISKVKSARIKAILRAITDEPRPPGAPQPDPASAGGASAGGSVGGASAGGGSVDPHAGLSLDWLASQPVPVAHEYLTSLPGVGRKTAACVLLFAFGMHDVPVDTHVSRVGTRLGLFRPGAPFEELHDEMLLITPAGEELEFHLNLLRHGRRTCFARWPACGDCALRRMCPRVGVDGA